MPQKPYLEAGQIVGTHGVRGEVRVQPWCDSPQQFATFKRLFWDIEGKQPVIVVGAGPAGLFAALKLIENNIPNNIALKKLKFWCRLCLKV